MRKAKLFVLGLLGLLIVGTELRAQSSLPSIRAMRPGHPSHNDAKRERECSVRGIHEFLWAATSQSPAYDRFELEMENDEYSPGVFRRIRWHQENADTLTFQGNIRMPRNIPIKTEGDVRDPNKRQTLNQKALVYRWRVRGVAGNRVGPWSNHLYFTPMFVMAPPAKFVRFIPASRSNPARIEWSIERGIERSRLIRFINAGGLIWVPGHFIDLRPGQTSYVVPRDWRFGRHRVTVETYRQEDGYSCPVRLDFTHTKP